MREILFRGQTRRYGEKVRMGDGFKLPSNWVYGGVLQGKGDHSIIYGGENQNDPGEGLEKRIVYTDTLGQYTGMTDKNGVEIFEGDICRNSRNGEIVSVKWHGTMAGFVWSKRKEGTCLYDFGELFRAHDKYEVIGNIRDDPELLEVGGDG